jgi:hypothetical protein
MNVEQRLVDALRTADQVEPSPDLWTRIVHSIEEDQAHRRRVIISTAAAIGTLGALFFVGLLGLTDGPLGRFVRLPVMELIETIALVALVAVLGPAIRRFGRGYAVDLWPVTPATATALLRLLDVAYVLVFGGFILMTVDFDIDAAASSVPALDCVRAAVECHTVQAQIEDALIRVGGLVLIMGLLHAVTIMALPVVALVSNSTRVGRALPRWLIVLLVLASVPILLQTFLALIGLLAGAS